MTPHPDNKILPKTLLSMMAAPTSSPTFQGLPAEVRRKFFRWLFSGTQVRLRLPESAGWFHCLVGDSFVDVSGDPGHTQSCERCKAFRPSVIHNILLTNRQSYDEAIDIYFATVKLNVYLRCANGKMSALLNETITFRRFHNIIFESCDECSHYEDPAQKHLKETTKHLVHARSVRYVCKRQVILPSPVTELQHTKQALLSAARKTIACGLVGFIAAQLSSHMQAIHSCKSCILIDIVQTFWPDRDDHRFSKILFSEPSDNDEHPPNDINSGYHFPISNVRVIAVGPLSIAFVNANRFQKAELDINNRVLRCFLRGKEYQIKVDFREDGEGSVYLN